MSNAFEATNRTVIEQEEISTAVYPDAPDGLSDAAAALSKEIVWDRLEQFTNYKIGQRSIQFRVCSNRGQPWWIPAERPFEITGILIADTTLDDYVATPVRPRADGAVNLEGKAALVTATVGLATAPPLFLEAYKRLAEYFAASQIGPEGVTRYSLSVGPDITEGYSKQATHTAKAMVNSGAADLLRKYRKLGAAHV
ncbi:hypothetical protein PSJ8397_00042 [Pseudooctadecabacter jejudonensis]|uniref:Uncharacterized protein n=2 Tax=Pseudooctadecabacter jejudonensis TaxID=1391910 RepID=A0A1Y5R761_9RHOB|nr:hypothetical protein PSJ8397_00042 [Pseudooctadecabacter jejudonensis]